MSADLLRRAAVKLREHANAATPGPWVHVDHGPRSATSDGTFMGCGQVITEGAEVYGGDIAGPTGDLYPRGGYSPRDDMALVALMHPPVALALAALFDRAAEAKREIEFLANTHRVTEPHLAHLSDLMEVVRVARAVLREEAS